MRFCTIASLSVLAMAAHAPTLAQADAADNRSLARANFAQADANKDNKLSKPEFRRFIDENAKDGLGRASKIKRFGAYGTAFGRLDANSDGFVTVKEIAARLQK